MPYNYGNRIQANKDVFHELGGIDFIGRGPDFYFCPGRVLRQVNRGFGEAAL